MRVALSAAAAACLLTISSTAGAAPWDGQGPMLAKFYNEAMSIPKGWSMSYVGKEQGVDVFLIDSDFDAHPMTAIMDPESQLRRVVCGDDTVKQWMAQGYRVRADQRALRNGAKSMRKGVPITRC